MVVRRAYGGLTVGAGAGLTKRLNFFKIFNQLPQKTKAAG